MNNKGFTLIELLAVIVILLGIAAVSVFSISSSLQRNEEHECERQKGIALNAAKIYFSFNDDENFVELNTLKRLKYIKEEDYSLNKNAKVRFNSSSGDYCFVNSCSASDKCPY